MGFQQGLSGLSAASENLNVIGNNVANASTVGFKESTVQFADIYAGAEAASSQSSAGIGVQVSDIEQDFSQGAITTTNDPLDVAINGQGFFVMSQNGANVYSRNGQFQLNDQGDIVNAQGAQLMGYQASSTGTIVTTATPQALSIPSGNLAASKTTNVTANLNLDSSATAMTAANFNPSDSTTYSYATSTSVYDSLGNSHTLGLYFVPTGENAAGENVWDVFGTDDGTAVGGSPATPMGQLTFTTSGGIDTANSTFPAAISLPVSGGAATPLSVNLDFTGTTQYGSASSVNSLTQNGYTSGQLSSYNISNAGVITGSYTNGQTQTLGQVALANFASPENLAPDGNNVWSQTAASGTPLVGAPSTGSLGSLQSGAVESSNVDLTTQLVAMINAQYDYQANAQTIKTQDSIMQTLTSL
ncbi:MAG: flagellar hook protein FlgE [Burkholderiaceae bacterium]|jgi:flagellar hook protein FlgE